MDPIATQELPFGQLSLPGQLESALPLESTSVQVQVTGSVASVAVVQRFRNPLAEPAELEYLFPLPHQAAIVDFELRLGGRVVRAELRELEAARQAYGQAQQAGQRAALLESRRANLFALRLANVLPGEGVQASVRYQERLEYREGEYEFVFPMGLTPRYHAPQHPHEAQGLDAPIATQRQEVGPVEITVALDAGVVCSAPVSPSHALEVVRLDERRWMVRLAGAYIPDHDFVLHYGVAPELQAALAAWVAPGETGEYFLANLLPPALPDEAAPAAREFVFVLDRSGSMKGEPIAQAINALRACLRALNAEDRFRILLFDDRLEWYDRQARPFTQAEVDRADLYLAGVEGRGGTEILAALQAVLNLPVDPQRTRFVVFLTDGAVSAEERVLERVRKSLGKARLFTFGIGPSVNRALLQRLARLGGGTAEFLGLNEDIEGAILRFQDRVSFPVLTDLSISCQGGSIWDVYPTRLPDLYAGQPLEICGRLKAGQDQAVHLQVQGRRGAENLNLGLILPPPGPEPALARLWARARVEDLLEAGAEGKPVHTLRAEIIGLALEHRLVTPYTAFVAVDAEQALTDGKSQTLYVAQPLPQGLSLEGFFGHPAKITMASVRAFSPAPVLIEACEFAEVESAPAEAAPASDASEIDEQREKAWHFLESMSKRRGSAECLLPDSAEQQWQDSEDTLRWLARSQRVDGSWNQEVLLTALALLAYVRNGHTIQHGHYRRQVNRAVAWLETAPAAGLAAFVRALALSELARASKSARLAALAQQAQETLPAAQGALENAVLACLQGHPLPAPSSLKSLEDLWLAVLDRSLSLPAPNFLPYEQDLARTLVACR